MSLSEFVCTQTIANICTEFNNFKYFYLTLIIVFDINHPFVHCVMVWSIVI